MRFSPHAPRWTRTLACLAFAAGAVFSQVHAQELVLAVNEGSLKDRQMLAALAKYRPLASMIEGIFKQPVIVMPVSTISALEEGMKAGRYSFVLVRPADVAARGLRDYGYRFVASSKPEGHCAVGVSKDSPLRSLADIRGKRISSGPESAYLYKMCSTDLRSHGIDLAKENVKHHPDQSAVPVSVLGMNLSDVALLEVRTEKEWRAAGHRVLHTSVSQPFFPLIAHAHLPAASVDALQKKLGSLREDGDKQNPVTTLGLEGFDTTTEKRLREVPDWLRR